MNPFVYLLLLFVICLFCFDLRDDPARASSLGSSIPESCSCSEFFPLRLFLTVLPMNLRPDSRSCHGAAAKNENDGKLRLVGGHGVPALLRHMSSSDLRGAVLCSPSSRYPRAPPNALTAEPVRGMTSLFQTAAGTFPERPQGKNGSDASSLWQLMDYSTARGEKCDKFLTRRGVK